LEGGGRTAKRGKSKKSEKKPVRKISKKDRANNCLHRNKDSKNNWGKAEPKREGGVSEKKDCGRLEVLQNYHHNARVFRGESLAGGLDKRKGTWTKSGQSKKARWGAKGEASWGKKGSQCA